jgi:hypothetical protein
MPQAKRSSSSSGSSRTRRRSGASNGAADEELERYRRASEDALQQLDWAIGYLHGIRKTEISKALAKNRSHIRTKLLGEAEEALPTQQTNET